MSRKVVITCALTGSQDTCARNPAIPASPEEIATSAIDAARAGARGEIDDDIAAAVLDALHHFGVESLVHTCEFRLGGAHMDMDNRRAGPGGINC